MWRSRKGELLAHFNMSDPVNPVRMRDLHERAEDNVYRAMTPAERIGMMWQLALDAWAFAGIDVPTISRDRWIVNKRASGRPEDLADVSRLTEQEP